MRRLLVGALGALFVGLIHASFRWPWIIEVLYARWLGPHLVLWLSALSGRVPLSVAELSLVALAVGLLLSVGYSLGQRGVRSTLFGIGTRLLAGASIAAVLFYVLWGWNYGRPGLATRQAWRVGVAPPDLGELREASATVLDATNEAYVAAIGRADLGIPTSCPLSLIALDRDLDAAYARLSRRLVGDPAFGRPRGPIKPLLLSPLLLRLHLAGFYFPWAGEANLNVRTPGCQLPHAAAHEKAHQRGAAREEEAQFLGLLACLESSTPYVRYAGLLFAHADLMAELHDRDRRLFETLAHRRTAGVARDISAAGAFWSRYEGPASMLSRRVNDRYLKAQGERAGLRAYRESTGWIVSYARGQLRALGALDAPRMSSE